MQPSVNNARYILELERNALLQEKYGFDEKYGTFSFAFLTSLETFALLAYLYIATVLIYHKETRTKTNFIVSVWAAINFAVLLEKLSREFGAIIGDDFPISKDAALVSQIISGLGRSYGSSLMLAWLFSRYLGPLKPKCDIFVYFLMAVPALVCSFYVYYYFAINKFIYEVYGPGSDVVNVAVYILVGLVFVLCKIFLDEVQDTSNYALMISLVNLITNFPICLITIYLRFNLDISWADRFHVYFVDFFVNALSFSSAFAVLFIIMLYNERVRQSFFMRKNKKVVAGPDPELVRMTDDY
ncbi:uncharacterized protein LOC135136123 [Zophobas morio]|uniref:uncharacterized protein LOC135136123 n=1 Tax=Zophobas morio TaxID=2755281 RepID=UPI003082F757